MKKNIVAIIMAKNEEEEKQQIQEIEAIGYPLYGVWHLHHNFSIKEIHSVLRLFKKYGTHTVLLNGSYLSDEVIQELSDLIKQWELETLVINHNIPNKDKRFMFLLCHVSVDIKMIISLLLKQHTTDLYVLIDNSLSMYNQPIEKLQQIAEILNVKVHFYSKEDMSKVGDE